MELQIKQLINQFLRRLLVRKAPPLESMSEEMLLNYALDLAQEWGDNWMQPIQPRLKAAFPGLNEQKLNRLNYVAQSAVKFGQELTLSMAEKEGVKNLNATNWRATFLKKFQWADEKNLKRLYTTGTYQAMKRGFL